MMSSKVSAQIASFVFADSSFMEMTPKRLTEIHSWHEHIPFAFWLVGALRPKTLVELGVHKGDSYSAFCQAVQEQNLPTVCYGIDTWKGEEHAGLYSEEVYEEYSAYHGARYSGFSRLIRSTFDEAREYFENGSVDLLHVDGRHEYEDVREDFESWIPKLSDRAVVLFHDINVKERNFGVWKYFSELGETYPGKTFSFTHCNGLGVLLFGMDLPDEVKFLGGVSNEEASYIRKVFSALGRAVAKIEDCAEKSLAQSAVAIKNESNEEVNALRLELRNAEIENYRAQFQLSCQLLECQRVIAEKDRILSSTWSGAGGVANQLTGFPYQIRRVKHAFALMGAAFHAGGGVMPTLKKARKLYKDEGFEGIKRGFRHVANVKSKFR